MVNKNKFHRFIGLIILLGYLAWILYEQNGWTILVTIKIVNILIIIAAILFIRMLHERLLKFDYQPTFPFIIFALLLGLALGISDFDYVMPFVVTLERWEESPASEMLSWFLSSLIYFSFMFAFVFPKTEIKKGE